MTANMPISQVIFQKKKKVIFHHNSLAYPRPLCSLQVFDEP